MNEHKETAFVFARKEVKYRVPRGLYPELTKRLDGLVIPDAYPQSHILSIYYDDEQNDLISRSLDKPSYKEKLRLRSYGVPTRGSTVFPELKKKYRGIVYKRRAMMTCREAEMFLDRGLLTAPETQILKEIAYFRDFYHPAPHLFIGYDRLSFVGKDIPDLRITFDQNIRFRQDRLRLEDGDDGELLDIGGDLLMEVKAQDALPVVFVRTLSEMGIYPDSFSKYGEIYRRIHQADRPEKQVYKMRYLQGTVNSICC